MQCVCGSAQPKADMPRAVEGRALTHLSSLGILVDVDGGIYGGFVFAGRWMMGHDEGRAALVKGYGVAGRVIQVVFLLIQCLYGGKK